MDVEVLAARMTWRIAEEQIDELVDRLVARLPIDPDELLLREESEYLARRAYYRLLEQRYGFPPPRAIHTAADF